MTPDLINGIFEAIGGLMLWRNCVALRRDKEVKGCNISTVVFFNLWGIWNLFYYPALGQIASFIGGLVIASANTAWVFLAMHYSRRSKQNV